ncbi:energy transducer TonB [Vibrio mimicus]|nr:energy transducer TonB [Vibrio mimicus]QXC56057.1 energy transducer TonB [Vibrio mimicus]
MTRLRYLIAGLIACLIHGIALSYTPQKNTINVSTEDGAQSLQIQLMTISASKPLEPVIEKKAAKELKADAKPLEQKPVQQESVPVVKKSKNAAPDKEPLKKVQPKKELSKTKPKTQLAEQNTEIEPQKTISKIEEPAVAKTEKKKVETSKTEQQETAPPAKVSAQDSKPMLVKKPKFSAKPAPVSYPRIARKQGLEGKVLIEVWLDEQGNQIKQLLLESSGHHVLDERALSTIKEWHFSHQVEQGQAIAHRVQIPINFQLQ